MGIDHLSKSLVEGSKSITFEGNSSNPNTNPSPLFSNPNSSLVASSLLSPISTHSPQEPTGLVPDTYNQSDTGSDASMEERYASESENDNELVSSESSEYIYDGSFDVVMDSTHFYNNNNTATWAWPASATNGDIPPSASNNSEYSYPTEMLMKQCHLCGNRLYQESKEIFIFKGEYAFCSQQCREVEAGCDEFKEKEYLKAQKKSNAKRLESIGKFPVVFKIGSSASASSYNN